MSEDPGYSFRDVERLISDLAIPAAEKVTFRLHDPQSFAIVALYISLLEAGWSCLALLEKRLGYHAYPLLRSMLEMSVDVDCLIANPEHASNLELANLLEREKMFDRAKSGNPYLTSIGNMTELETNISETKGKIDTLRERGAKKLSNEEKFKNANRKVEYDGLWRMLGNHVHGNLNALISRHIDFSGDVLKAKAFNHGELADFIALTTSIYEIILHSSQAFHRHFGSEYAVPEYWEL